MNYLLVDWWKFNGVEQAHMRVYVNVHNINRHMSLLLNLLSSFLALRVLLSSTWIIDMVEPNRYHAAGYNQAGYHLKYTSSPNEINIRAYISVETIKFRIVG